MITLDKTLLSPMGEPDTALLCALLAAHGKNRVRLNRLKDAYDRKHKIDGRTRLRGLPNNRLAHDLPGYIVAMAAGYLVGSPVGYTPAQANTGGFAPLREALAAASSESVDAELAADAAVYGKGMEIYYADPMARPRMAQIDPRNAFVVYDDTVEHLPILGITISEICDSSLKKRGERVAVYTREEIIHYERKGREALCLVGREPHFFGGVPLVEYWNNSREEGDFEAVLGLIDAYDALQSDRVNDKQQFTDSILALYGVGGLGTEDGDETGAPPGEPGNGEGISPSQRLRQTKTLFMPGDGARAEWLTKPLAEADTEVLRKSLKDDIHKLCLVPDLSDESFAGNASGVAMRFKLFGLEQLTKIKERWFREGLRSRLRLFAAFLAMRGAAIADVDTIQISFQRSLPVNETEIAAMVAAYDGIVPRRLLLGQVPFVDDPEEALKALAQER